MLLTVILFALKTGGCSLRKHGLMFFIDAGFVLIDADL